MSASKIFFYFCLSFIGGIFISSFLFIPQAAWLIFAILGILLISVLWSYKKLVVIGFCILFAVLGIWRHQTVDIESQIVNYNYTEQTITLIGLVSSEPDLRERAQRLTIKTDEKDKVLITTWRYPEYQYGDKLKITGKLESPPIFEDFNYRDYLRKDGIYSQMSWPEIEVIGSGHGNLIYKILFSFKDKFKTTARSFISSPQEGILEALVFGDEENIPQEWKDKLNFTGTRHITAVSGMNITIIASLLLSFALAIGLWRGQAFYLSVFLLMLYILMIGAPSSAVRAGFMAGLFLLAQYWGRMSGAQRAVIFAASFMLFLNPLLLKLDIGFQLSFLAILGIIYLQPTLVDWFRKVPNHKFFPLRTTLSTTFSAQVFTLPILIYNFGYIPLISPLTNILIVPFLAPITILIFMFGLAGMIFWLLGLIFSWPTWLVLTYITKVIDISSQIPFASLTLKDISWVWLVISYLILGLLTWRMQERQRLKFLNY